MSCSSVTVGEGRSSEPRRKYGHPQLGNPTIEVAGWFLPVSIGMWGWGAGVLGSPHGDQTDAQHTRTAGSQPSLPLKLSGLLPAPSPLHTSFLRLPLPPARSPVIPKAVAPDVKVYTHYLVSSMCPPPSVSIDPTAASRP